MLEYANRNSRTETLGLKKSEKETKYGVAKAHHHLRADEKSQEMQNSMVGSKSYLH